MQENPNFDESQVPAGIAEVPTTPPTELSEDDFYLAVKGQERYIMQTSLSLAQMSQSLQMMVRSAQDAKDQGLRVRFFQKDGNVFFTTEPKAPMGFNPKK